MALRILLADDEKDFVETLAERLELRGHTVRVVFDGLAALSAVAEEMPDVVVLDLLMPGLPGDEAVDDESSGRGLSGRHCLAEASAHSESGGGGCYPVRTHRRP